MPSTNVRELFEKFMEDPEYIGKEPLALAEAQQRVRQSMNNHRALSMAKSITPMEELLEFLIKKSVEKNVPAHFQRNRDKQLTNLIVPEETTEMSHQDLLDAIWTELLPLAPEGSTIDDILNDPSLLGQGISAQGHQMFSHTARGEYIGDEGDDSNPFVDDDEVAQEAEDVSEADPDDFDQAPGEEIDDAGEETRGRQEGEGVTVSRAAGTGLATEADYGTRQGMHIEDAPSPKGLQALDALNELRTRAESPEMRDKVDRIREFIQDFNRNEARYVNQPTVMGRNPLAMQGETTTRPVPGMSAGRTRQVNYLFHQALAEGLFEKPEASRLSPEKFEALLAHVVDLVNKTPEQGGYKGLDKTHKWPKTGGGHIHGYNVLAGEADEDGAYNLPEGFTQEDLEKELKNVGLTLEDLMDKDGNINSNAGLSEEGIKARQLQQQILQTLQALTGNARYNNMFDALAALVDIGEKPADYFARKGVDGEKLIQGIEDARGNPRYARTDVRMREEQDPETGEVFDIPTEEETQARDFSSYQNSRNNALKDLHRVLASLTHGTTTGFKHPTGDPERITHPISPKQNYLLNNVIGENGSLQAVADRSQQLIDAVSSAYSQNPEQYMTYKGFNDLITETAAELGLELPSANHLNPLEQEWVNEKNSDGSSKNAPRKELPSLVPSDMSEMQPRDLQRLSENNEITLEQYIEGIKQISKKYPHKVKNDFIQQAMFSAAGGTTEIDPGLGSSSLEDYESDDDAIEEATDIRTASKGGQITAGGGLGGMFRVNSNGFWDVTDPGFLPSPSIMDIETKMGEPTSFISGETESRTGRPSADVIGGTERDRFGKPLEAKEQWYAPPSKSRRDKILDLMRPNDVNLTRDPITNAEVMPQVKPRPTDLQRDELGWENSMVGGYPIHYATRHQKDWDEWKPLMELHLKAGVPLEDLLSINPETGQKIWSPESMNRGHQKHGFLNWGEDHKPRSVPAPRSEGSTSGMYEQMLSDRASEGIAPFLPGITMGNNDPNIHIEDGTSLQSNLDHSASKRRQAWIKGRTPWQIERANQAGGMDYIFKQMRNHWNRILHQERSLRPENKIGAESLNGANDPLEDPFNRTRLTHSTDDTKNLGIYTPVQGRRDFPTPSQIKRHGDPEGITDSKYYEVLLNIVADAQDEESAANDSMSTFAASDKALTGELQSRGYLPHPEGENSAHSSPLTMDSISDAFPEDEDQDVYDRVRSGISSVDSSKGSIQRAMNAISRAIGLTTVNNYQSSQPGKYNRRTKQWEPIPLMRGENTIQSENGYDEVMRGGPDGQGINTLRQAGKADHLGNPFALEDEVPEPRRAGVAFKAAYSDQHGHIPANQKFEVSTKGNDLGKQFSAKNAKLPNGRVIEDVYKKDIKGGVGSGKVPEGMSKEDLHKAYTDLWRQWADANPEKLAELAEATRGKTLIDRFAYSTGTGVSQARSLAEILNERHGTDVPEDDGVGYVNHSGGAHGADQDWDFAGTSYGVTSNHYHMMDKRSAPRGHLHTHTLSRADQAAVDERLDNLNKTVLKRGRGRDYHGMPEWSKDNFRRNALGQVDNADGIFAISTIGKGKKGQDSHAVREGIVDGGTAWAVHLAIQEGERYKFDETKGRYIDKPVYVFDQEDEKWYEWNYSKNKWDEYQNEATDNTPTLTPHFAGIGTREINVAGSKAIRDVYRHTFGGDALEHPVDSSVRKFEEWLRGTAYQDVEPERRQAILDRIDSGDLNGRRLDYYTKEHANAGRNSHADVLAKLINEGKVTREQGVQGFLKALEPHTAVYNAFNSLSKRDKEYIFNHFFPQKEGLGQVGKIVYTQHGQPYRIESIDRDNNTLTVQQMKLSSEMDRYPGEMSSARGKNPVVLHFKVDPKTGKPSFVEDRGEEGDPIDPRIWWEEAPKSPTGEGLKLSFYSSDPTKESSALSWSHGGGIDGYGFTAAHDAYSQAGGASSAPGQSNVSPRENILAKLGYYPNSRMAFKENLRGFVNYLLGSAGEVDRVDILQALESAASALGLSGIELPRAHEMSRFDSSPYEQTLGELRKFKALYPERMTDEDEKHLQLLEEQAAADEEDGEDDTGGTPVESPKPGPGSSGGDNTSLADVPPTKLASALGSSATGLSEEPDQNGAIALLERELPATKVDDTTAINHAMAVNNGWGGTTDNAHEIAHFAHHAVNPDLYPGNGSHPLADLGLENLTEETEEGIKPHSELHNILGLPSSALINLQHIQDLAKAQAGDDKVPASPAIRKFMKDFKEQYNQGNIGGEGDGLPPPSPPTAEGAGYGGFDHMDEAYGLVFKIQRQQDKLNHPTLKDTVDPITPQELERYNEAVEYLKARTKDGRISIDPSSNFFNTPLNDKERDEILTAFKNHNQIMTDLEPIGEEYLTIPEEQGEQEENIFDPPYEHKEGSIGAKIQELADNIDTIGFQGRKQLFDLLDHVYGSGDRGAIGKEKIAKLPTELYFEDQVSFDALQPRLEEPYNEEDWPSTPSLDSSWTPEDESHYLGEAEEVPPSNQNHVIPMADLHQTMINQHGDRPNLRANINWTNDPLALPDGSRLITSKMIYGPGGKRMFRIKYLGKGPDVAKMIESKGDGWYENPESSVGIYYSKTDKAWKPFDGFNAEGRWGDRDSLLPHASWRLPNERYEAGEQAAFWTMLSDTLMDLDEEGKLPTDADFASAHWGSEAHHESDDHADGTTSSRMRDHDNDRSVISPMAANTFLNTSKSVEANETINNASDEDKADTTTSAGNHLRVADERLQRYLSGGYMSKDTPEDTKFVQPEEEDVQASSDQASDEEVGADDGAGPGPGDGSGAGDGSGPGDGPGPSGDEEQDPVAAAIERINQLYNEFEADGGTDDESRKIWWDNQSPERQQQYLTDRQTIEEVGSNHPAFEEIAEMKERMEDLHAIASPPEEEEREETGEGQQPSGEEQLAINDYLKTEPLWDKVHYSGKDDSGNYIYTNRFTEEQMPQFTSVDQAKETVEKFKQFNITYKDVDFVEISTPDIQNQDAEKLFEDRTNSLNEMATMLGHPVLRNRVGKNAAQLAEGDISNPELRAERGIKYLDDERLADHTRKYGDSFEGVNTEDPDALLEAINGQAGFLSEGATTWLEKLKGEEHPFVVEEGTRSTPHWFNPSTNDEHSLQTTDSSSPQKQLYHSDEAKALHARTLRRLVQDGLSPVVDGEEDIPWPGTSQSQKGRPFWAKSLEKEIESLSDLVTIANMYKRYPYGRRAATADSEGRGSLVQTWIFPTGKDFKDERDNNARTEVVKARLYVASQHLKQILVYMNKHWQSELHDPINYQIGRDGAFYYHTEEAADPEQQIGQSGSPITGAPLIFYPAGMPEHKPVQFKTGEEGNQYIRSLMRGDKLAKIESVYDAIAHEFISGLDILGKFSTEFQGLQAIDQAAGNNNAVLEFLRDELGGLCYPSAFKEAFIASQRPDSRDPNNKVAYSQALKSDLDDNHRNPASVVNTNHPMSPENQMMQNLSYNGIPQTPISGTPVPEELFDRGEELRNNILHPDAVADDAFDWIGDGELFTFKRHLKTPASNAAKVSRVEGGKFVTGAHVLEGRGAGRGMTPVGEQEDADLWDNSDRERFSSDPSHDLYGTNWHKYVSGRKPGNRELRRSLHHALEILSDPAAKNDPEFDEDEILSILRSASEGTDQARLKRIITLSDNFRKKKIKQNKEKAVREKTIARQKHWDSIVDAPSLQEQLAKKQAEEGPNAVITADDATKYARNLVRYLANLENDDIDYNSETKKDARGLRQIDKVDQINEKINEAIRFGADIPALDRELQEWGRGSDVETPFGSPEHMEAAEQADNQRSAEKEHYDKMMDPSRSSDVSEAWDDETYEPDGIHEFDPEASSSRESSEYERELQEWENKRKELATLEYEHGQKVTNRPSDEAYERHKEMLERQVESAGWFSKDDERMVRFMESLNPEDWKPDGRSSWDDEVDGPGQSGKHQWAFHYTDTPKPTDHAGELAARKARAAKSRAVLEERQKDLEDYTKDRDVDPNIGLRDATSALNEHMDNKPVPTEGTSSSTWKPAGKLYSNFKRYVKSKKQPWKTVGSRHTFSPEREGKSGTVNHSNQPTALGIPEEHRGEYQNLHHDKADGLTGEAEIESRTNDLRTKLAATGHDSALDHPHFGTYDRTPKVDALTKQPPKHPTTGKQMSLIPDVGWADKDILQGYQKEIGQGQGVYHPKGLIHDEDGNVTDTGLYIDRSGFHGVAKTDPTGNYTHSNVGVMTPAKIRQHDLGHKINAKLPESSLKESNVEPGVQVHRFNNVSHPSKWEAPTTKPSQVSLIKKPSTDSIPTGKKTQTITPPTAPVQKPYQGISHEVQTSKIPFLETMSNPLDFRGAARTAGEVWRGTGRGIAGTQVGAEGLKGAARAFYNPSSTRLGAKLFGGGESSVEKSRPQSLNLLDDYIRKAKK